MKPVVLIVLDGFGIAPPGPGNAVYLANPAFINSLYYTYPNTTLKASGESVGLPPGDVGNTEVGHISLGAGKIVYQDLPRINLSIADGTFYNNQAFLESIAHIKKTKGKMHIVGLISDGLVHSSLEHLYALLYLCKEQKLDQVYIHVITDGRDSPPQAASELMPKVEEHLKQVGIGKIASISGRYYAMDRDHRWERTEKAYLCLTEGKGEQANSVSEAIKNSYAQNVTDEFILPTTILDGNSKYLVEKGDSVIFFNFRIDRPRQLTKAFVLEDFAKEANSNLSYEVVNPPFKRGPKVQNLFFVTMTEYEKNLNVNIAYPPIKVKMPLGRVLAEQNKSQLHMSESEKERFVTYYFNGQREQPFPQEQRLIIPSPKVPTYDLKPEMAAQELTTVLIEKMETMEFPFIIINFANPDMVGHTGNIEASIIAVKTIDSCLQKIVTIGVDSGYTIFITGDHGNVEQKINPQTGQISTEHTANPVPFIAVNRDWQGKFAKLQSGILADVATTILAHMELPKPAEMTGRDLLEEIKDK